MSVLKRSWQSEDVATMPTLGYIPIGDSPDYNEQSLTGMCIVKQRNLSSLHEDKHRVFQTTLGPGNRKSPE